MDVHDVNLLIRGSFFFYMAMTMFSYLSVMNPEPGSCLKFIHTLGATSYVFFIPIFSSILLQIRPFFYHRIVQEGRSEQLIRHRLWPEWFIVATALFIVTGLIILGIVSPNARILTIITTVLFFMFSRYFYSLIETILYLKCLCCQDTIDASMQSNIDLLVDLLRSQLEKKELPSYPPMFRYAANVCVILNVSLIISTFVSEPKMYLILSTLTTSMLQLLVGFPYSPDGIEWRYLLICLTHYSSVYGYCNGQEMANYVAYILFYQLMIPMIYAIWNYDIDGVYLTLPWCHRGISYENRGLRIREGEGEE